MGVNMIKIKRIYEKPDKSDGYRILVDKLWPRGIKKEKSGVDLWLKDIAPSDKLRKWFSHREDRWEIFKQRYMDELKEKIEIVKKIKELEAEKGTITLLFSARDIERNNAVVLREFISHLKIK